MTSSTGGRGGGGVIFFSYMAHSKEAVPAFGDLDVA